MTVVEPLVAQLVERSTVEYSVIERSLVFFFFNFFFFFFFPVVRVLSVFSVFFFPERVGGR